MFAIKHPNLIESDEGFSVERISVYEIIYSEGSKRAHIHFEFLTGSKIMCVYKDSFDTWDTPNEKEEIDDKKHNSIMENIRRAYLFKGYEIEIT